MGIPESVEESNLSLPEIGQSKEDGVIQRCGRVRRRSLDCELFLHKELGLRRPKTLNASELVTLDAPVLQTVLFRDAISQGRNLPNPFPPNK